MRQREQNFLELKVLFMWFCETSDEKEHTRRLRELIEFGRPRPSNDYTNCLGISTHPQCYCVCVHRKRATAEECLNHPWLNPHSPSHPHLHAMSASSLDEPEMSQSESEPESPAPSPELAFESFLICPVQGELKTGRHTFSFSEPPFRTRSEIKQELICWPKFHLRWETRWIQTERSRGWGASKPAASGAVLCSCFTPGWLYCCDVFELSFLWLHTSACFCVTVLLNGFGKTAQQEKHLRTDKAGKKVGDGTRGPCCMTALLP